MKLFIQKLAIFIAPVLTVILMLCFSANGHTDQYYLRFTTPQQTNLIIGTSRAAQGIVPKVINEALDIEIYNYSFNIALSPFGQAYFESIRKKHDKKPNGTFIIAVDPWSISSWSDDPEDQGQFRENSLSLANQNNVCLNPNFEYLYKNISFNYKNILYPKSNRLFLHNDGWLEVSNIKMDSTSVRTRTNRKITNYKFKTLPKSNFSKTRYSYLKKTIEYLKTYGKVFLVRLPVDNQMLGIEDLLLPDFQETIEEAIALSDGYLDLTPFSHRYIYTDGNHLYKNSSVQVSKEIGDWIKNQR